MNIRKWCLFTAIIAASLTVAGLKFRQVRHDAEIRRLRAENDRLRGAAYRLQATRSRAVGPGAAASGVQASTKSGEPVARTLEEYRNEGRATARATLQTLAWCCDRGDMEALTKLVQLEPEARAKAEAYYASLPAEARARWASADAMVATFMTLGTQLSPFPSADVLAAAVMEPAGDDRLLLRIPGTNKDRLAFRRGADGTWSYVMDAAMIERLFTMGKDLAKTAR